MSRTCNLCTDKLFAKGLCSKHYNRLWRYGDPHVTHRPWELSKPDTLLELEYPWRAA